MKDEHSTTKTTPSVDSKMNRRKTLVLIASLGVIAVFAIGMIWSNASSVPAYGTDPSGCHSDIGYSITANRTGVIPIAQNGMVDVEFTASGANLVLQIVPGARDNNLFFSGVVNVTDNGAEDLNGASGAIRTVIMITAPAIDGNLEIMVIARDGLSSPPNFAYIILEFQVGAGASIWDQIVDFFMTYVFNHMQIYLGGAAVFSLGIGTLLYEYGRSGKGSLASSRYVKAHGILAATSLVLTTINVFFIISATGSTLTNLFDPTRITLWTAQETWHFLHIVFGITGYACGILAVLTGLAGIRTRIPGYLALLFWGFNFVHGLIQWVIPTW
jgi:hypothetical protein